MQFAIFEMVPCYDVHDSIAAWAVRRWNHNTYETLALAQALARRAAEADHDDVVFEVRLANGKRLPHKDIIAMAPRNIEAWSPIPF